MAKTVPTWLMGSPSFIPNNQIKSQIVQLKPKLRKIKSFLFCSCPSPSFYLEIFLNRFYHFRPKCQELFRFFSKYFQTPNSRRGLNFVKIEVEERIGKVTIFYMKLISWNIDSLNAALTGESRARSCPALSLTLLFPKMRTSSPFKRPNYPLLAQPKST